MNTCSCYHPLYVEEDDDKLNYRPCQISAGSKFYFLNKFVFLEHNIERVSGKSKLLFKNGKFCTMSSHIPQTYVLNSTFSRESEFCKNKSKQGKILRKKHVPIFSKL